MTNIKPLASPRSQEGRRECVSDTCVPSKIKNVTLMRYKWMLMSTATRGRLNSILKIQCQKQKHVLTVCRLGSSFACLSVCLIVSLPAGLLFCLEVYSLFACLSVESPLFLTRQSPCLRSSLSLHLSICCPICFPVYFSLAFPVSVCLRACLSVGLFVGVSPSWSHSMF